MILDYVTKARSYRRFYGEKEISMKQLEELVELARLSPCAANKQSLKYILVCDRDTNEKIFPLIGWAGYLQDWDGPVDGEHPTGYIIMLRDTSVPQGIPIDEGIAAQSIFLGAAEAGLGGCFIGNVKKKELKEIIGLSDQYEIALLIALGVPKETVVIDEMKNNDVKYYRDETMVHHVPKRSQKEIIVKKFGL